MTPMIAETVEALSKGPVEVGAFAALLGMGAYVGRAMLNRLDKTLEKLDENHAEQIEDMRATHSAQLEMLQTAHAQQVETLTGLSIENQRAMTALTVQIDRYTREMHELAEAIHSCPGVVINRSQGKGIPTLHTP